jgi:hypothetical protein
MISLSSVKNSSAIVLFRDKQAIASFPAKLSKSIIELEDAITLCEVVEIEELEPKQQVLRALLSNVEKCPTLRNGVNFDGVYLDNALASLKGITPRQFAGYLSALKKDGMYIAQDKFFGMVKV